MSAPLTPALRPMLPADAPVLAAIFRAAIETLAAEDYSPAQLEAWIAAADDEDGFARKLGGQLTLIATVEREPAGFASLKDNDYLDMIYVRPEFAGRGVAKTLVEALETLAAARGQAKLTADVSDAARDFFAHRGYTAVRRNTVELNGQWLGNTTMEKSLPPARKGPLQ